MCRYSRKSAVDRRSAHFGRFCPLMSGTAAAYCLSMATAKNQTDSLVHLEVRGWSGKLVGANSRASDVFTLLKIDGEWKITHKLFHWHSD